MSKALVMGASGFLGSHVVKELVSAGRELRIMVRSTSDTSAIDHLNVERFVGDITDEQALLSAMEGCSSVFYCIVDTRAWLRDPAPLYKTNVEGLRRVMDVALAAQIERFVFTSTYGTIGINPSGVSSEDDVFNWWDKAPDYIRCRVEAENLFMDYCANGLPGIACCVGNTYGSHDDAPTPHGNLVKNVAKGKMGYYWDGGGPVLGIRDAAKALLLAEHKGSTGKRYIIAERWMDYRELFACAAKVAGVEPPKMRIPLFVLYTMAGIADFISFFTRKDNRLSIASIRCSTLLPNVDSSLAKKELGWVPLPIENAVEEAVEYYLAD